MSRTTARSTLTRRTLLKSATAAGALSVGGVFMPHLSRAAGRPVATHGVQSGDITADRAIVWARADRPSRMMVEVATTDSFKNPMVFTGPDAIEASDYTAKLDLTDLPADQDIFYRVKFLDLADMQTSSEPVTGHLRTAPMAKRDITFVWSGDTAGQGWGIDRDRGGMKTYATMLQARPDFFIHSGDTIYADGKIEPEVELADGTIWKNVTTEEKSKVAETLKEFRGQWKYNLLDDNVRAFNAQVPMLVQWDDHEVTNNWYPGEQLISDDRYTEKSSSLLSARSARAFFEMNPIRANAIEPARVYRKVAYGPSLDIFFLDMRTYRGPNSANDQSEAGGPAAFLGRAQLDWLKRELLASKATWKVIAADMPIGMIVRDGDNFENGANGDGPVKGREHDIAEILRFIKNAKVLNTVWLTADVHYTAAHYYDPNKAQFQDFEPFWEFVSGPLHAGTFGPNDMDNTFGPQVKFTKHPSKEQGANLPPSMGLQFFGQVKIDGDTEEMTVTLKDRDNADLYEVTLEPKRAG
ncbi:alkaline phosphatase D family protein [Kaustia mangrovi]|uniref:Alkaline phosphatase D family protein n=1 Tax=Kaustia mangrovi TaxID=2593653 RepID=A0A7S8C4H7_9HYPH|nr:alkaline phosphatase D family protein [Kaustia mangrovi]QPC43211.1 alkaline phosphatase D family protein [Kaustia mangrovi]